MKSFLKYMIRLLMGVALTAMILQGISVAQTPIGTRIDNLGMLQYKGADGGQQDTIASNVASTVVERLVTLKLTKSVSPASAIPGDTVTYTIVVWNSGNTSLSGVFVRDTLHSSFSVLSISRGSVNGNIVSCDMGTLPADARDTLTILALVRQGVAAGSLISNLCTGTDTSGSIVVASADLPVNAAPRIDIQKLVSSILLDEGDTLSYTITLANTGNTTLTNVMVRDTLPVLVQYLSGSSGVLFSGGSATYMKDSLVIGERDSFSVQAIVQTPIAGGTVIPNTARVTTDQTPLQSASASSVVRGRAAVVFAKTVSRGTAQYGDTVFFTLHFRNTGNIPLTNIIISDTLPQGLSDASGTNGSQWVNGVYSFLRDTLHVGQEDSAVVATRVSDVTNIGHTVVNRALIASDQTPVLNAQASFVYMPSQSTPSVSFLKSGPGQTFTGDTAAYTISLSNGGPGTLTGVVIIDTLDANMQFISATQNGSYDGVHHRIIWQFALVDTQANISCTATVAFSDTLSRPTTVLNRAALVSNEISGVRSEVSTFVSPPALLSITKSASAQRAFSGDTLVYTLTVRNISLGRGDSLVITDMLPDELDFVSAQPVAAYTSATRTLVWSLDSLSAGDQRQFIISAIVKNDSRRGEHDLMNTALLSWTGGRRNTNLQASSQASVKILVPYLRIEKQAVRRIVEVGDLALYTISVTNLSSNTTAYGLTVVDYPPLGFTFVPGSSFRDSFKIQDPIRTGKNLQWTLADSLLPGASIHLSYRMVVGAGALDGTGVNSARALAFAPGNVPIASAVSSDRVEIRAGVFTDRGLVIGKVFYDDNENKYQDDREEGIKGVELIVEDGTRVTTGDDGKYSLPEVAPGDHVIRLLTGTLPSGDELLLGYGEFANVPSSRFVRVPESGIARSDFYVRRKKSHPAQFSEQVARAGTIAIQRTASPKYLLFVNDERLVPVSIKGTQFETGKAKLRPEAYPTLKAVADYAREYSDQLLSISGHTDASPIHSKEFPSNKELSEARAMAVRDYLVGTEHVDSTRITTIGLGESQPVASNAKMSGRALNRRVEITMSSAATPFENYFKAVWMNVSIDYDGGVPISRLVVNDEIDTSFHFVEGSAFLGDRSISPAVSGKNLVWAIDSIGTAFHRTLTYEVRVFAPHDRSETIQSRSTLKYVVADSATVVDGSCTATNVVARTTRQKPVRFVMSGVLFDAGKATLKEEAANSFTGAAEVLLAYPHSTAFIDGYTDSRPIKTPEFSSNVGLSHARAMAVLRQLMINYGIDSSRLHATGWGELKPVASNLSEAGRKANRRVEMNIDKQDTAEGGLREGSVDSSLILLHRVDNIRSAVSYDSTTEISAGDRIYLNISVTCPVERATVSSLLIDSLPAGIVPVANSVTLIRGIDSIWTKDGALHLQYTRNDSVHIYSLAAEVTGDVELTSSNEHVLALHRTLKNGKVLVQRSQPMMFRLKNRRVADEH